MELRAGKAKRRKLSCTVESCFSYLSTKTKFQENSSMPFVFSDAFLLSCELYLLYPALLSFPRYLSDPTGVSQSVVAGLRHHGDCPSAQLSLARQHQHRPFPGRTKALHLSSHQPHCTAVHVLAFQSVYRGPGQSQG